MTKYPIEVRWSEEDHAYIAEVFDLPGCMADGPTEAAAIEAAHEAIRLWLDVAQELGREIPPPSVDEPASGKFNLRIPVALHRELQRRARRGNISLNQLVVALLVTA